MAVGAKPRLRRLCTRTYDCVRGAQTHWTRRVRSTFRACAPHWQHHITPPDAAVRATSALAAVHFHGKVSSGSLRAHLSHAIARDTLGIAKANAPQSEIESMKVTALPWSVLLSVPCVVPPLASDGNTIQPPCEVRQPQQRFGSEVTLDGSTRVPASGDLTQGTSLMVGPLVASPIPRWVVHRLLRSLSGPMSLRFRKCQPYYMFGTHKMNLLQRSCKYRAPSKFAGTPFTTPSMTPLQSPTYVAGDSAD